jgi:hypothetical protein
MRPHVPPRIGYGPGQRPAPRRPGTDGQAAVPPTRPGRPAGFPWRRSRKYWRGQAASAGRGGVPLDHRPGSAGASPGTHVTCRIPILHGRYDHAAPMAGRADRRVRARSSAAVDDAALQDGWLGSQAARRSSNRATLFSTIRTLTKATKFGEPIGEPMETDAARRRPTASDNNCC